MTSLFGAAPEPMSLWAMLGGGLLALLGLWAVIGP